MRRTIYYVSDGTGITAETIGHSVLTQFDGVDFQTFRIPFVDDDAKARSAALRIKTAYAQNGVRPIVINTIMDQKLSDVVAESGAFMLDVFAPFIGPRLSSKCCTIWSRASVSRTPFSTSTDSIAATRASIGAISVG